MKYVLSLAAAAVLACAAAPGAAAQESPLASHAATGAQVSLDLPRASYSVVSWHPSAPTAEERSQGSGAMPRAARNGAIVGAVAGGLGLGSFRYLLSFACEEPGGCGNPVKDAIEFGALGAVAGAAVGYLAGRAWHAVR